MAMYLLQSCAIFPHLKNSPIKQFMSLSLPLEGLSSGIQSRSMHLIAWKNEGGTYGSNANEFEAGSWD